MDECQVCAGQPEMVSPAQVAVWAGEVHETGIRGWLYRRRLRKAVAIREQMNQDGVQVGSVRLSPATPPIG